MKKLTVLEHPIVTHKLCAIRDKTTPPGMFRRLVHDVSLFLAAECLRVTPLIPVSVETPLTTMQTGRVDESGVMLVSVLRAGNGLLSGFLELVPDAQVRHLGLARNEETRKPTEYYSNLSSARSASVAIVLDPMLATGGTAVHALRLVMQSQPKNLILASLISAPEGVNYVHENFPSVHVVTAAVDECLNERGYIVPGLGDAGDRLTNC